jgi:hypothetical protein
MIDSRSSQSPARLRLSLLNELSGTKPKRRPALPGILMHSDTAARPSSLTTANDNLDWLRHSTSVSSANQAEAPEQQSPLAGADILTMRCSSDARENFFVPLQSAPHSEKSNRQSLNDGGWETEVIETFRNAFDVVSHTGSQTHADVRGGMNSLYQQIADCVRNFEQSGDRRTIQYLQLSADEVFHELGPILFSSHQTADLIDKLSNSFAVHGMSRTDVLRSFAAVALTWWPQKVFDQCREQWELSCQGPLERGILHGKLRLF